jgi:CheY-like chemotaxis protein
MSCTMPRVLCVDDEPKNLDLLEAMLLPLGYDIVFASNGLDALKKIKTEQIDICLLDVMMPGIDGFEVCHRIKSDDRYRNIPVVMITSYTGSIHRTLGIEAGADDFISKPVNRLEVLARIKILLEVKLLNDLLNAARKSADRSMQMVVASRIKTDLLTDMSHELLTPLNAVIDFSTALHLESYGLINEKQHECVNHIISGVKRLQELITGIIEFTRSESDSDRPEG